jgi:hypothetical protein
MDRFGVRDIDFSELPAWIGFDEELRLASHGLATATLVVLLICASRESLAEGAKPGGSRVGAVGAASSEVVLASVIPLVPAGLVVPATTTPFDAAVAASPVAPSTDPMPIVDGSMIRRVRQLDALLAVRSQTAPLAAREVDATIAAAVAQGHRKELEKKQPFRKQSHDLFRTERPVQFGDQEMVLRLRLRAKTRDAMSVELRF